MLGDWAAILLFVLFAGAIAASLLLASIFVGRRGKRVGHAKTMPFESGVAVAAYQPSRFSISYYLTAMMFIVFDIEMVFLAPLAVLMRKLAAVRLWPSSCCSSCSSASATSTSGERGRSSGSSPSRCAGERAPRDRRSRTSR